MINREIQPNQQAQVARQSQAALQLQVPALAEVVLSTNPVPPLELSVGEWKNRVLPDLGTRQPGLSQKERVEKSRATNFFKGAISNLTSAQDPIVSFEDLLRHGFTDLSQRLFVERSLSPERLSQGFDYFDQTTTAVIRAVFCLDLQNAVNQPVPETIRRLAYLTISPPILHDYVRPLQDSEFFLACGFLNRFAVAVQNHPLDNTKESLAYQSLCKDSKNFPASIEGTFTAKLISDPIGCIESFLHFYKEQPDLTALNRPLRLRLLGLFKSLHLDEASEQLKAKDSTRRLNRIEIKGHWDPSIDPLGAYDRHLRLEKKQTAMQSQSCYLTAEKLMNRACKLANEAEQDPGEKYPHKKIRNEFDTIAIDLIQKHCQRIFRQGNRVVDAQVKLSTFISDLESFRQYLLVHNLINPSKSSQLNAFRALGHPVLASLSKDLQIGSKTIQSHSKFFSNALFNLGADSGGYSPRREELAWQKIHSGILPSGHSSTLEIFMADPQASLDPFKQSRQYPRYYRALHFVADYLKIVCPKWKNSLIKDPLLESKRKPNFSMKVVESEIPAAVKP